MKQQINQNADVIVITGASSGVGRALAHRYAKNGANIALLSRSMDSLKVTKIEVEALGAKAIAIPTDVSDAAQVEKAAQEVMKAFGKIDIWINNAMVSVFSPVKEMTAEEYKRVTDVTYLGAVHGTLSALKIMLKQNHGTIVQVCSALSKRSIPLQSAYCAAKHALDGFSESLRCELLHDKSKVEVIRVQLPAVNTPQFRWVRSRLPNKPQPVPPIYQPELVADAIHYASYSRRREVYIGYPTWKAILGEKFAPGFTDWYLSRFGYTSQQTSEKADPHRSDNLYEPRPEKAAMHGDFDDRAISKSFFFWAIQHRALLYAITTLIFFALILWCKKGSA